MRTATNLAAAIALCAAPLTSAITLPTFPNLHSNLWSKRASSTVSPAAISIGSSQLFEGDDGPWSSFAVQIGTRPQTITAFVGTSVTSVLAIAADGLACPSSFGPDCQKDRGYVFNPNSSLTYVENSKYNTGVEIDLGLSFGAISGFDVVTIGYNGGGGPTIPHSAVFTIGDTRIWTGVLGLAPYPNNFSSFTDPQPSILESLALNQTIPSMSIGYTAGNQYRASSPVFGSLTLGGYDQSRFQSTGISFPMFSDISKDLSVSLHSITTDSGSVTNLLPGGQIQMFIDSTVSQIWLPQSACTAFEQAFGLTYNTDWDLYYVNASLHETLKARNPNVTFTIGGYSGGSTVDITLPYGAFDLTATFPLAFNPNSTYYFPLQRAANNTQYVFGRTFLQEAYLIADYDRKNFTVAPCNWNASVYNTPQIKSILRVNATGSDSDSSGNNGTSSGISGGAIAGIIVGIVALVAIIGLLLFFLRRRKTTEKKRLAELDAAAAKRSQDSGEEKPFMGGAGGELAGEEIHELRATHADKPQELASSQFGGDPSKAGYSEMDGEHYGPGKRGNPAEMEAARPIFEMAGSDVHEMPAPQPGRDIKY